MLASSYMTRDAYVANRVYYQWFRFSDHCLLGKGISFQNIKHMRSPLYYFTVTMKKKYLQHQKDRIQSDSKRLYVLLEW